jgi:hypothetical protein
MLGSFALLVIAPHLRKYSAGAVEVKYPWSVVARVLHVLAIVLWIGGITTVTAVIFPAISPN